MEEIIVSGGYAILRNVQEVKRVRTDDLLALVAATAGVRTPLLPEGSLLLACKGMRKILATCHPSGRNTFKTKSPDGLETLEIAHPWLVFVHVFEGMAYESMKVYGASMRPASEDEPLLRLPFRNLYSDCKVCMGRDVKFSLQGSFASKAEAAERHFFESAFNSDLDAHARTAMPEEEGWNQEDSQNPMQIWAERSADEGFNPLNVPWRKAGLLGEILDGIIGRPKP